MVHLCALPGNLPYLQLLSTESFHFSYQMTYRVALFGLGVMADVARNLSNHNVPSMLCTVFTHTACGTPGLWESLYWCSLFTYSCGFIYRAFACEDLELRATLHIARAPNMPSSPHPAAHNFMSFLNSPQHGNFFHPFFSLPPPP